MNHLRQVLLGVAAALLSVIIVLGSFSLALTEGMERVAQAPATTAVEAEIVPPSSPVPPTQAATQAETASPSRTAGTTGEGTTTPTLTVTPTSSASATVTASPPAACSFPEGWDLITVGAGDTLESLAEKYNVLEDALMEANCLFSTELIEGTLLAVPVPPITPTQEPKPTSPPYTCGAPRGWVIYIVQNRETLYSLSRELGVSVAQLQAANCLGSSTLIRAGQELWVPRLPSRPAPPAPTPTQEPPTPTSEPPTPTEQPPAPTLTVEPSPVPTSTLPPTPSPAPSEPPPTSIPEPTSTPETPEPVPATEEPVVSPEP